MSLVENNGRWVCASGGMCFAPCPGCPYASGELPMPSEWLLRPPSQDAADAFSHMIIGIDWSRDEMDRQRAWTRYLMGFAEHAATKSKDSTKVGAALVDSEGTVLLTGYNGPPRGVMDHPERRERPQKYAYVSHAEQNLVAFAARKGIRTDGHHVYVTHMCCAGCAKTLIQAGIRKVVYGPGKTSMPAEEFDAARAMFSEAGVVLEACDDR
jgi:dCMP deaminase